MKTVAIFLSLLVLSTTQGLASIGDVIEQKGNSMIERQGGEELAVDQGTGVESYDTVKTANGRTAIQFVDDTRVDVTEHSKLLIDEFVYDPNTKTGALSINAALGTVRYASGQIAKNSRQNIKIKTPTATIAVRGTDFIMVVDELGGSMITLLPSCDEDGLCYTGEIEVETDAGFVILNQAFQATMTTHNMRPPGKPYVIGLPEERINQLLILRKRNPYVDEEYEEMQRKRRLADFLGIDFLQYDGLSGDALVDTLQDIWVTDLDESDYMLRSLLTDLLDELNMSLMRAFEDELSRQNRTLLSDKKTDGTGFDPVTGIRLDDEDPWWHWVREDFAYGNKIDLYLSQGHGYSLNIKQGDFEIYDYKLGTTTGNNIDITQSGN